MNRRAIFPVLALVAGVAAGVAFSFAGPALAGPLADDASTAVVAMAAGGVSESSAYGTLGTGAAVACTSPPVSVDDTSVTNTTARTIVCANPSTNTVVVRIGGATVGANAAGLEPGQTITLDVKGDVVPKCYAASSTTIQCTEYR